MQSNKIKEGIYTPEQLSNEDYHADPAVSSSMIKSFVEDGECLAMFWCKYINPDRPQKKETEAMKRGTAAHIKLLEPEKFDQGYEVLKDETITTKVPAAWKKFKKECEEKKKKPLLWKEFEQLNLMAAQIQNHELAQAMLFGGLIEHSFFSKHQDTNLILKARPDHIANVKGFGKVIVDYKTTGFLVDEATQNKEAFNQKRYIQGAFHKYVVEQATGAKIDAVVYVCQMTEYPYLVRCFQMDEPELEAGMFEINSSLEKINQAMTDPQHKWPDFPHEITKYEPPAWFNYKYNN